MREGILHLRIAYDYDVEPEHRKAFQGGMALWNAHKDTTGVLFEEAKDALVDIRLQRGAPAYVEEVTADGSWIDEARINEAEQGTCAEYVSRGSYIWYSRNILNQLTLPANWLKSDVVSLLNDNAEFKGLAKIYAHELGHALNLAHGEATSKSVMREGDKGKWCLKLAPTIPDIQPEDKLNAYHCACGARGLRAPGAVRRP